MNIPVTTLTWAIPWLSRRITPIWEGVTPFLASLETAKKEKHQYHCPFNIESAETYSAQQPGREWSWAMLGGCESRGWQRKQFPFPWSEGDPFWIGCREGELVDGGDLCAGRRSEQKGNSNNSRFLLILSVRPASQVVGQVTWWARCNVFPFPDAKSLLFSSQTAETFSVFPLQVPKTWYLFFSTFWVCSMMREHEGRSPTQTFW